MLSLSSHNANESPKLRPPARPAPSLYELSTNRQRSKAIAPRIVTVGVPISHEPMAL